MGNLGEGGFDWGSLFEAGASFYSSYQQGQSMDEYYGSQQEQTKQAELAYQQQQAAQAHMTKMLLIGGGVLVGGIALIAVVRSINS